VRDLAVLFFVSYIYFGGRGNGRCVRTFFRHFGGAWGGLGLRCELVGRVRLYLAHGCGCTVEYEVFKSHLELISDYFFILYKWFFVVT